MSTDDYKKDLFVNDEDRKLWESISNDAAEILHLKVRLLRECMSSSPPPEDGSTQSSSAARKERLPRKSPQDAPIYPLLAQKIKKAYRVNRKQQKLVEQAKAELAERIENHTGTLEQLEALRERDIDLDFRMSALISEQTTTWSIPDQFQENEDVKALLNIWRTTQGGAIIKAFAENRPPPEDDMVTHVGGDCEMGDG